MTITIDSQDVRPYRLSVMREASVCQIGQTMTIILKRDAPEIECGDLVYLNELGLEYSGWVTNVTEESITDTIEITTNDCCPINDHFITDNLIANAEDVAYWINYFLDEVGMKAETLADTGYIVPAGTEFQFRRLPDVLVALLTALGQRYIRSDGNWKAVVRNVATNDVGSPGTVTEFSTLKSLSWIRNHVTVLWDEGETQRVTSGSMTNSYLDGESLTQRLIIAHPMIRTEARAEAFIERALDFFADPLYLKMGHSSSGSALSLGDTIQYEEYGGVLTKLREGFYEDFAERDWELDSRCQTIWDWAALGIIDVATLCAEVDLRGTPLIATLASEVDLRGTPVIYALTAEVDVG